MLTKSELNFDVLVTGGQGKNFLIFTEHVNATYYISFDIPLRALHNEGLANFGTVSQSTLKACAEKDLKKALIYWLETLNPTVVIMSRYAQPHGEEVINFYKNAGIKIVYHIDDDLLEIPSSLGQKIVQQHGAPEVVAARRYLLENCDLVYASTEALATLLKKRFPTQNIVYGDIYAPYLGDLLPPVAEPKRNYPIIGYMGSKGHQEDLELVVPDIVRLMEEHPELHFEVFGTIRMPDELLQFPNRTASHGVQKDYWSFLTKLKNLQWDIGLAPLVDAPFNHCKAPTKFIEYTSCGIPVVASDLFVYKSAIPPSGGILVRDNWYEAISPLLNSASARAQTLAIAVKYCKKIFSTQKLQQQLLNTFKPTQSADAMNKSEIENALSSLSPEIPWAHYFEFAPGLFSVSKKNEQFYKKATGLKRIGEVLLQIAETQVYGHTLQGKKVLDLACGEGGHSVQFAQRGAEVLGVEGRKLYVERARFAAEAMAQPKITILQGDVRKLDPKLGTFDIVLFSGILHHLGIEDFDSMITELGRITDDLLLIYTHVVSDLAVKNHNLQGPVKTSQGREGFLFREHKDDATAEQKEQQVRASLDNTFSFWAREDELIGALRAAGFSIILKVMSPHAFGWENASYRPFLVAKK